MTAPVPATPPERCVCGCAVAISSTYHGGPDAAELWYISFQCGSEWNRTRGWTRACLAAFHLAAAARQREAALVAEVERLRNLLAEALDTIQDVEWDDYSQPIIDDQLSRIVGELAADAVPASGLGTSAVLDGGPRAAE